jgi:type 2A phosphatase activator TIP41
MPHSFFILQRLFLRVDKVLFRIHDVRVYHEFGTEKVIRETTGLEANFADVKAVSQVVRSRKRCTADPISDPHLSYLAA